MTIETLLEERAKEQPTKTALVMGERRLSYQELNEGSNKLANALIQLGLSKGDGVALLLPISAEFIINYFGVTKAGGIAIPMDIRLKPEELEFLIRDHRPEVLIGEDTCLSSLAPVLPDLESVRHVISCSPTTGAPFLSYQEMLATAPARNPEVELGLEDIALIRHTSGTTGRPKGIMLSHGNMLAAVDLIGQPMQQTRADVMVLFPMPPGWAIAMCIPTLARGGTIAIAPGLTSSQLLRTIAEERGTILFALPFLYSEIANMSEEELRKYDLSSLRLCLSSGVALPEDVSQAFRKKLGLALVQTYGSTEAPAWVTMQPLDGSGKPGSTGKVTAGCELRIVDDKGGVLPPNQAGEIIFRNAGLMRGYHNRPQATAEALREGWFYTGDIGKLDKEGHLFVLGRKKEMITVAGQAIFPIDVEEAICSHPKVSEAAIVGIPTELGGEALRAIIVPKVGETVTPEEIQQFCRQHLTDHEVPQEIVFKESLPKTLSGKVRREELRI